MPGDISAGTSGWWRADKTNGYPPDGLEVPGGTYQIALAGRLGRRRRPRPASAASLTVVQLGAAGCLVVWVAYSLSGLTSGVGDLPGANISFGIVGGSAAPGAVVDSSALSRAAAAGGARHGWSHRYPPLRRFRPCERCTRTSCGDCIGGSVGVACGSGVRWGAQPESCGDERRASMAASTPASGVMLPPPGRATCPAAPLPAGGARFAATASWLQSGGASARPARVGLSAQNAAPTVVPTVSWLPRPVLRGGSQRSRLWMCSLRRGWPGDRARESLRNYLLDWAVGKFRSSSGSETVVISNDGSGYVPEGVYLPRDVRLLVADPLVEQEFRDYWFGWQDPARVLVACGPAPAGNDWQLGSGGIDGPVDALREAHVECGSADPNSPLANENWQPAGIGQAACAPAGAGVSGPLRRAGACGEGGGSVSRASDVAAGVPAVDRRETAGCGYSSGATQRMGGYLETNREPPAEVWEEFGRELNRYTNHGSRC